MADVPDPWPVLHHDVLARGRVCDFIRDVVQTPDGGRMTREYMAHPGAVGVMALDDAGRVAVVRQYRHPVGYRLYEPPAGLLDHAGEDYLVAARRELAEEAQLAASDWRVLVDLFTTPGGCEESIRMFLATGLTPTDRPDGFELEGEEAHMDAVWVPVADLVDAVLAGRVQSPSMVSGTLALALALERGLDTLRPADALWPAREAWAARRAAD
ncbi:NUDIX domain-containing protein [Propionicicella superfundia]|uniref:NUDIX domain-containing protein n=1 Tax=Propionicicella superfundia TaxID=348582 RepID=UPI00048F400D|nr:NUDIX hydrolase [Propionicicella superfundia]